MENHMPTSTLEVLVVKGQSLNISEKRLKTLMSEFEVSIPLMSEALMVVEDFSAKPRKVLELHRDYGFSIVEIHSLYEIIGHLNGSDYIPSLKELARFIRHFFDDTDQLNTEYVCDIVSRLVKLEFSIKDFISLSEEQNENNIDTLMTYLESNWG